MKRQILIFAAAIVATLFIVATPHTFATTGQDICRGVQLTGASNCTDQTGVNNIAKTVVQVLSLVVGITAVIFIIIGGFKFVTSSGDAQKAASARNTIIYAVVGLVVVALAQAIVAFVLTNVTKK